MTVLKVYGVATNRTMRTTWMANELGLEYELIETSGRDGSSKSPEFLAINPNGSVPAIQDDGHTMWESLAINLYLAKKHGGELAPKDGHQSYPCGKRSRMDAYILCQEYEETGSPCSSNPMRRHNPLPEVSQYNWTQEY